MKEKINSRSLAHIPNKIDSNSQNCNSKKFSLQHHIKYYIIFIAEADLLPEGKEIGCIIESSLFTET